MLVGLIPGIGSCLSLLHMAMLYALYSFEYKWIYQGELWMYSILFSCYGDSIVTVTHSAGVLIHNRVNYVEKNWPYFLGFGLPLAILTAIPSSLVIR